MKIRFHSFLMFALFASSHVQAQTSYQDIRIMTYNLLSYRTTNGQCTGNNNNPTNKDAYLKDIVQYIDADILVCNEIGSQTINSDRILTNALNSGGVNKWNKAEYSNNGSNLVNMLFYDSTLVGLKSQVAIDRDLQNSSLVRVVDFYRMYYKDPALDIGGDTTFFQIGVAHLKAGSASANEQERGRATLAVMDYLKNSVSDEAVMFCGDLNVYSSNEAAFQNLISYPTSSERFHDPINTLGGWNNSPLYSSIHTQSTRSGNTNSGCFASGGCDDRFDFILMSDRMVNDPSFNVLYVNNSYETIGNDGLHFNKGLKDLPNNSSAPSAIIDALYNMSDHLPVAAVIKVAKLGLGIAEENTQMEFHFTNPIESGLKLWIQSYSPMQDCLIEIQNIQGQILYSTHVQTNESGFYRFSHDFQYRAGVYLISLTQNGYRSTKRCLKK